MGPNQSITTGRTGAKSECQTHKYISDAFTERRAWLDAATADPSNREYYVPNPDRRAAIVEDHNEYLADSVFWVPEQARWPVLQANAKQADIDVRLDAALDAIEAENLSARSDAV